MGLTPAGQGARAVLEGWTAKDGRLPVNPSGGLKAKGHPIGATGVSMHAITAMQLTGQAGTMQLPKADLGGGVQHGRRGGGELRFDPGGGALIPTANLAYLLDADARARFPDRPAMIWRDRTWTWAAVRRPRAAAAGGAGGARRAAGDRVLLHARNSNRRAGNDVRRLDARRGLGADQFPPDPAGGGLSGGNPPAPRCTSSIPRSPTTRPRRGRKIPSCRLEISLGEATAWPGTRSPPMARR